MYYVYVAFSENNQFRGVGVTNNLARRFKLLRRKLNCNCKLVFFEEFSDSEKAIDRENELNALQEEVLIEFIEDNNPIFVDLLEVEV